MDIITALGIFKDKKICIAIDSNSVCIKLDKYAGIKLWYDLIKILKFMKQNNILIEELRCHNVIIGAKEYKLLNYLSKNASVIKFYNLYFTNENYVFKRYCGVKEFVLMYYGALRKYKMILLSLNGNLTKFTLIDVNLTDNFKCVYKLLKISAVTKVELINCIINTENYLGKLLRNQSIIKLNLLDTDINTNCIYNNLKFSNLRQIRYNGGYLLGDINYMPSSKLEKIMWGDEELNDYDILRRNKHNNISKEINLKYLL